MFLNMDFKYVFEDRLPDGNLEEVVSFISSNFERTVRVAIYGMAEAGQKLFSRLSSEVDVEIIVCFDSLYEDYNGDGVVVSPDRIGEFQNIDLIINTVPPQYIFQVCRFISDKNDSVAVLNLYDIVDFVLDIENWDYAFKIVLDTNGFKEPLQSYYREVREKIKKGRADFFKKHSDGISQETTLQVLRKDKICLGKYLDREFRSALCSKDAINRLILLAENYPFYGIARDAAATLLVQEGNISEAVSVFFPIFKQYPLCAFSHKKYAELCFLNDDQEQAVAHINKALQLKTNSCELIRLKSMVERADKSIVWDRWNSREIRPKLNRRKVDLRCAIPVWGEEYISLFIELILPSLMAPGNIPHLSKDRDVEFILYTREQDMNVFDKHSVWQELKKIVRTKIVTLESLLEKLNLDPGSVSKYSYMSHCQNDSIKRCVIDGKALFIPLGDSFFSSRYLSKAVEKLDRGYKVVFVHGAKVSRQGFGTTVQSQFLEGTALNIPASQMLKIGADNFHQNALKAMDKKYTNVFPRYFIENSPSEYLLYYFFSSNPIFFVPSSGDSIDTSLDMGFPYQLTDGGFANYILADELDGEILFEMVDKDKQHEEFCEIDRDLDELYFHLYGSTDPFSRYLGTRILISRYSDGEFLPDEKYYEAIKTSMQLTHRGVQ